MISRWPTIIATNQQRHAAQYTASFSRDIPALARF
jgi:hypothetical protein